VRGVQLGAVVRGRTAVVLLGVIPLLAAGGVWINARSFDDVSRSSEKLVLFWIIGLGLLAIAVVAGRAGAGRWTPLWVLGGAGCGVLWFYAIGLVLLGLADTSGGCPGSRIYC
jgi:hypothetical protein